MMQWFDYFYYRVAKAYFRKDGSSAARAVVSVSALQMLLVSTILLPVVRVVAKREVLAPHAKNIGAAAGLLTLLLIVVNYKRYSRQYFRLKEQWQHEPPSLRRLRGYLVAAAIPVAFFLVVLGIFVTQRKS